MAVWRTYRELLRNRPLSKLLLGEFVSSIGDWLYLVALVVLVYRETHDPVVLGIIGAARLLPYVFLSIPAGIIGDRFDRRHVLLVSDLVRAGCMVVLAWLVATDASILLITAVASCCPRASRPSSTRRSARSSRASSTTRPSSGRRTAPGRRSTTWRGSSGPGIAGVILAAGSIELAFVLNAVSFSLIAVVLWSLPPSKAAPLAPPSRIERRPRRAPTSPGGRCSDGACPASIDLSAVTGVILLDMLAWFAFGGINILIVILAVDTFQGGDAATGFLNSATGVGGTIGAILSGVLVLRSRLGPSILIAAAAFAASVLLLGIAPAIVIAFIAIAVASVGHLVLDVARTTILQRVVPDAFRGRFTGILMTSSGGSEAIGTLVVPILAATFGLGIVLGMVALALFARHHPQRAVDRPRGGYRRRPVRRAAARDRAAAGLRRLVGGADRGRASKGRADPGRRRRRRHPPGRRRGSVLRHRVGSVRGDAARGRRRGAGPPHPRQARGLRRARPARRRDSRTATITALEDGLVFVMDGATFLAVVGARRGMAEKLLALYEPMETPVRG